jgi:hypothetical protein
MRKGVKTQLRENPNAPLEFSQKHRISMMNLKIV